MEPQMNTDQHRSNLPYLCASVFICGCILMALGGSALAEGPPVGRLPMMKDLYMEHMRKRRAGGCAWCFRPLTGRTNGESWGVLEYQGQDVASAPKMQAVREMVGAGK
jgi:hypothetical protein